MPKVLLVDDDAAFRKTLAGIFDGEGFSSVQAATGPAGLRAVRQESPDLIVLDLVMPGLKGTEVCLKLKQDAATAGIPILILTGNDTEGQDISCLDMGADDYLTKPVRRERLLAHCRALLRRHGEAGVPAEVDVSVGDLKLVYKRKLVTLKGRDYAHLTPKEFELLYRLARHSPGPRQREELYREVWGMEAPSKLSLRTVEVHVRRIRLKLGWRTGEWLTAVTGRGYCLIPPSG